MTIGPGGRLFYAPRVLAVKFPGRISQNLKKIAQAGVPHLADSSEADILFGNILVNANLEAVATMNQ